jgi:hypothetical protein
MQIKRNANDIQQNIASGTITCFLILIITVAIISSSLSSSQAQIINNNIRNSNIKIEILQADSKPYGRPDGGNGLILYQKMLIQLMMIPVDTVLKVKVVPCGFSRVRMGILLTVIVLYLLVKQFSFLS